MGDFVILAVDDDIYSLENIKLSLANPLYEILTAIDSREAEKILKEKKVNLLVTDYKLPCKDGLELAEYSLNNGLADYVILITGFGDEDSIEPALKIGVKDFLRKPYQEKEFLNSVEKIYNTHLLRLENEELKKKLKIENRILRKQVFREEEEYKIIGKNKNLKLQLERALQIAKFSETALLQGESGTGKELLARFIHRQGARSSKPFVAINAAALAPTLFESELFGYTKGAFTGADASKPGLFEIADGGILFLDEISEIPHDLQAKLLRVIETGKVRRVGDNTWHTVDVQIIASTNKELHELISGKILRQDLYHRLASSTLSLPPLRERRDDIPLLLEHYFKKYNEKYDKNVPMPKGELLQKLINHDWPGNIRQLINFVKNYVLFESNISPSEIDTWLTNEMIEPHESGLTFNFARGTMEELEEAKLWLIKKILQKYDYNKAQAAKHLGMSYPGLHALIKKYDLM